MNAPKSHVPAIERLRVNAASGENAFFKIRKTSKALICDTNGYWSYPAFVSGADKSLLWLFLILPAMPMPGKKMTALFRPKAIVLTKPNTSNLVYYEHFRSGHDPFPTLSWDKPVAMFPHKSIGALTYQELQHKEESLLAGFAGAEETFRKEQSLPGQFRSDYLSLIHPVFLPYFHNLAPAFVTALRIADE